MWPFKKPRDPFDEARTANIDKDFSVFAAGEDAPTLKDIEAFEKWAGFRLPDDFRKYSCSKLGGIYVEVKESVWPRLKKFEVAPFWSALYGFFVYAFSPNCPEWMNIRLQTEQFRAESQTNYMPFLKVMMDADIYCFDENGVARRWNHETLEALPVGKTFTQIFEEEFAELKKRKERKLAELKKV
ncbi:MAG TPA: SMI1/KNR4 family protein [Candidatus Polarisedimenticolia bacterium]|nr:SMI1/KNR4 family protein [Candidatus Polarisedimenticolia bacterium]